MNKKSRGVAIAVTGVGIAIGVGALLVAGEAEAKPVQPGPGTCPLGSTWDPVLQRCVAIPTPTPRPAPAPPPKPKPAPAPAPKPKPKPAPTPTPPPKPAPDGKAKPKPSAKALGAEAQNTAIVVVKRPASYAGRTFKPKAAKGTPEFEKEMFDWLANVAFWATYPKAPKKLSKSKADKPYREAWSRIRGFVARGYPLWRKLGPNPVLPDAIANIEPAKSNWHRWALAMSFRGPSHFRNPENLRTALKKGWFWVFKDDEGKKWAQKHRNTKVAGRRVDYDGLLGEAGGWLGTPGRSYSGAVQTLREWPDTLTKMFTATNGTFTRTKV